MSASTYGDPASRIHSQSQFHEDSNHVRSHRSEARTVLEEEEHEDQWQRSPCLRLQQLPYFLPEDAYSQSDVGCRRVLDAILIWPVRSVLHFLHVVRIKHQLVEFFFDGAWRNPSSEPAKCLFSFFIATPRQQPYWCLWNLNRTIYILWIADSWSSYHN